MEETSTVRTGDDIEEHALRNAGDEIEHGIGAVEGGQVHPEGLRGVHSREDLAFAFGSGLLEGVIPSGAAAGDSRVGVSRRIGQRFGRTILR